MVVLRSLDCEGEGVEYVWIGDFVLLFEVKCDMKVYCV